MAKKNEVEVLVTAQIDQYEAQMREAAKKANELGKALKASDKGANTLAGNMRRLAGNLSVMRGPLDAVTGRVNAAATLMERTSLAGAGLAVAVSTAATALVFATRAAIDAELSMARVDGVLKATGYAAGLTAKNIEDMAQSIAFATLASVEGIRGAASQLLTFKTVSADVFERTLLAAQDLAETGFGSVENGAVALGKAMENPAVGLTSLREKGISFTDQQKEQIEDWVRLGESAKAAGAILEIVEGQVGGVAKEVADATAAGDLDTLSQSFTNLGRAIAETLRTSDLYRQVLGVTTDLVKTATYNINNSLEKQVKEAIARVQTLKTYIANIDRDVASGALSTSFGDERREQALENLRLAEENLLEKRKALNAETKRIFDDEVRANQARIAEEEKQRAIAKAKLDKEHAEILTDTRRFVDQQIEISKQGGFGSGGAGNAREAEAARYAAAQGRARAQMEKDMAKDRLDNDENIRRLYADLEVQQKVEHYQRLAAIDLKEAEERRKALEEQMKRDFKLRQSLLESQARTAGATGEWKRELELQKQAAAERAVFEYEQAVLRGESEIEVRKQMLAELLAVESEFIEKKNEIYQKAFEKEFKRQQTEEEAMREMRIATFEAVGKTAATAAQLLSEQSGAGFEAYKAMAIAEAGIAAALAQLSILKDMTIHPLAKIPLMAVMAAMTAAQIAKISSAKAPGRAAGGSVTAGSAYTVGEMGRELFIPSTHGSIVSNSKMGSLGGNTTVNIIESQERGGQTEEAEDGSLSIFVAAVKASVMRDIQRGTGIGSMVQRRGYR